MFLCEFCKIVKNIFWQDTSGWLLLVFICEFWVVQITTEYLCETSYFKYKLLDFNHKMQDSAASRCILVPFERYGRPKNVFPYIFHVKPKWNIVYKYSKKKKIFFKRLKYPFPNALNKRYFWTPSYNYWGFGGNVRMQQCRKKVFHKCFSSILYKSKK